MSLHEAGVDVCVCVGGKACECLAHPRLPHRQAHTAHTLRLPPHPQCHARVPSNKSPFNLVLGKKIEKDQLSRLKDIH